MLLPKRGACLHIKINTKEEKTVESALTVRTDSTSEPRVGAGDES